MRLDYTLYVLAVVFFIITATSFMLLTGINQTLWAFTSTALGAISIVAGMIQTRSLKNNQTQTATATTPVPNIETPTQKTEAMPTTAPSDETPPPSVPTKITEAQTIEPSAQTLQTPQSTEGPPTKLSLTDIAGIGEKRAMQLNNMGITTVEELTQASATIIAETLKVSPKIATKWVREAKKLAKKEIKKGTIEPLL